MVSRLPPAAATLLTLLIGGSGAAAGWAVDFPAYILTGPALAASLAALAGLPMQVHPLLRDAVFLVIGIGIGSTVSAETVDAIGRWPLAFAMLALALAAMMWSGTALMRAAFGFPGPSAVLAAAPGHLSFVMGLSAALGGDAMRIAVVQSLRLLALTLAVPLIARASGVELSAVPLAAPTVMSWSMFAVLLALSLLAGLALQRARIPAALLIGAMVVSALAHGAGLAGGGLDPRLAIAGFATLGALIGTRFTGVTPRAVAKAALAGLSITLLFCTISVAAALPVALWLDMPVIAVVAAFAPGGFETMIALGAVLGAEPGFVAAAHVARLMMLLALIPIFLRLARG